MYEYNQNMNQFNNNSQNNNIYADINYNYNNSSQSNENFQIRGSIYSVQDNNIELISKENEENYLLPNNNFELDQKPNYNNYIPPAIPEYPLQAEINLNINQKNITQFGVGPNVEINKNNEIELNNFNTEYTPQIDYENKNNTPYISPYKVEVEPKEPPYFPPSNEEDEDKDEEKDEDKNEDKNENDNILDELSPSVPKLGKCSFYFIIILGIIQILLSIINIIILVSYSTLEHYSGFIIFDNFDILFGVVVSFSVLRIKWLRYLANGLSVLFLPLTILLSVNLINSLLKFSKFRVIVAGEIIAGLRFIEHVIIMCIILKKYEAKCCPSYKINLGGSIKFRSHPSNKSKKDHKSPFSKRKNNNKKKNINIKKPRSNFPKKKKQQNYARRPPYGIRNHRKY